MKLVIVESPSKAKTINKYLGKDFKVVASYGHIRKLVSKSGSIDPKNNFTMLWEETPQAKKYMKTVLEQAKTANEIFLATDPDREGEAISWHLVDYLKAKKALKANIPIKRVVFNSITKDNILLAFKEPRTIDDNLVNAYKARTALDYLVGFNVSPILWRKLPGSKSAGRVQSVALRLICDRENEIEDFNPVEYWSLDIDLFNKNKDPNIINARVYSIDNKVLNKLDIKNNQKALDIKSNILNNKYSITNIENKKLNKSPYAPFTTSTLQQDAFNKLGFSAKKTMQLAQKLYEGINIGTEVVGLITYMRTDATQIDPAFIQVIRQYISSKIGDTYLYKSVRIYQTKNKNAQEAHEAIRPTSIEREPDTLKAYLESDMLKLYTLIWKRSVASQMSNAVYNTSSLTFNSKNNNITLRASGSILVFDGFYKVYNPEYKEATNILPEVQIDDVFDVKNIQEKQHFTEPPPRYTEATIVKQLEEMGIGRPSTYASIISVLQEREYTKVENKKFIPEVRGRILNVFLSYYFTKILEYNFTADMEENLDSISSGKASWLDVLQKFWNNLLKDIENVKDISPLEITEVINKAVGDHFIGENKSCPKCHNGNLLIKPSKFGAFIGCSGYPECTYTKPLEIQEESNENIVENNTLLGYTPTQEEIHIKKGPYGFYVEKSSNPPKRIAIPTGIKPQDLTLDQAVFLLSLPLDLGEDYSVSIGKFGPYIKKGKDFFSYKEDILGVTLEKAKSAVEIALKKKVGINLGKIGNKDIIVKFGRFGAYIPFNNKNIKIPKPYKAENLSLEDAKEILKI